MEPELLKCEDQKAGRVLRHRKHRKIFEEKRPAKKLFTPEIKKYLKGWLVRRRENPYPNREEKRQLAVQTGLTYIQICNWFANWRRKLKNSAKQVDKYSWGGLIKSYNTKALGNVEQFSLSSNDSIWEEPEPEPNLDPTADIPQPAKTHSVDHSYTILQEQQQNLLQPESPLQQCFQISSTSDFIQQPKKISNFAHSSKIVNKYFRKKTSRDQNGNYRRKLEALKSAKTLDTQLQLLTKWRQSAAAYEPSDKLYKTAYFGGKISRVTECVHGREELDAAEALTFLSRAAASKPTQQTPCPYIPMHKMTIV